MATASTMAATTTTTTTTTTTATRGVAAMKRRLGTSMKTPTPRRRGSAAAAASSPGGQAGTDENSPPYQVAQRKDTYELRIYGGYYVAAAPYSNREQGLASLMGYVEGGNEDEITFPATQPLMMRYVEDDDGELGKSMELSLGKGVTDPPAPTVPGVSVAAAGGELMAVVGFEGIATPELAGQYRRLLTAAVEADGLQVDDPKAFRLATYGQLYSLKPRLNELLLKVKLPGAA